MHVLLVSCVYPPEPVVSSQTSAQIAQSLVQKGHKVTVVTDFPNRPAGTIFRGYSRRFYQRSQEGQGFEVIRCFSSFSAKSRMLSRFLENLTFGLTSGWKSLTIERPDVIYANTWPIVATGILFAIAKLRQLPLVVSVQDMYPEALIAQRRMNKDSLLIRMMRWLDGVIARHANHLIVISERFLEIYQEQRKVTADRISLIPNWIDGNSIDSRVPVNQFRDKKGIDPSAFLLVYGGNIGVAAGIETTIEAIYQLRNHRNIHLLIAGAGSQLKACQRLVERHSIEDRVTFHTPWLREETSEVLRAADVLLLPTQREQSLVSVPSKLLSYMLAARPIIAGAKAESDLADIVNRSHCGWVVEPERPSELAKVITDVMQTTQQQRQRRGNLGRTYVLEHFEKSKCLPKVVRILEQAAT